MERNPQDRMSQRARQLAHELADGLTLEHGVLRGRKRWYVADASGGTAYSRKTIQQVEDAYGRLTYDHDPTELRMTAAQCRRVWEDHGERCRRQTRGPGGLAERLV